MGLVAIENLLTPPSGQDVRPAGAAALHACWSKAGVWGQGDCPELEKFIHCRNCPIYSNAAATMLDGLLPAGYREAWTTHFAARPDPPDRDTLSLLVFRVGAEWLALPVSVLAEVIGRRPVHSLPHARSPFVKGIVNVRGQLLPCVSLMKLLQLGERAATETAALSHFDRLLVVAAARGPIAFPVSEVAGLCRCRPADLREPPATVARGERHFTRALLPWRNPRRAPHETAPEDLMVALLDEQRLLPFIDQGLT